MGTSRRWSGSGEAGIRVWIVSDGLGEVGILLLWVGQGGCTSRDDMDMDMRMDMTWHDIEYRINVHAPSAC